MADGKVRAWLETHGGKLGVQSNPDFAAAMRPDRLDELAREQDAGGALVAPRFNRNPLAQAQVRVLWQGFPQTKIESR